MVYWLYIPVALAIGCMVYVYALNPHAWSNRLLAAWMLCIAGGAAAWLVIGTTPEADRAWWASFADALLRVVASSSLSWFLAVELVWEYAARPAWVRAYTTAVVLVALSLLVVVLVDYGGRGGIFFGEMTSLPGGGFTHQIGQWVAGMYVMRAIPIWGAAGVLIWHAVQGDRLRRSALIAPILALLLVPTGGWMTMTASSRQVAGIDLIADGLLMLAWGYALSRRLFAPIEMSIYRIVDSLGDGLVILDRAHRVLRLNSRADEMLGIGERQARHQTWRALFEPWKLRRTDADALNRFFTQAETSPDRTHVQEFQIGADRGRLRVRIHVAPIRSDYARPDGYVLWMSDVTELRRHESSLEAMLEEQKALALAATEMSSPVLPVLSGAIVMPLIGHIDISRARLILDALLKGISDQHAHTAILDFTGALSLSEEAVTVLWQAIHAVRLLGAEPILAGVQPTTAEVLSSLDMDMAGVIMQVDLQSGLLYAAQKRKT